MSSKYDDLMKAKGFLPYKLNYLPSWMIETAERELKETDENRGPAIEELRKLITEDKDLNCWTDDEYLLQFLRARKFNVGRALSLLRSFYKVKKEYNDVYPDEFDETKVFALLETGAGGFLPYRDEKGAVVVVFKIGKWNCDKFSVQTTFAAMTMLLLASVECPATQVCGVHIIMDVKGIGFKHLKSVVSPRFIQLLSKALSNTLPVRFKGIHIFNESFIFTYMYNVIKLFLSEKINSRIHFHGDNAKHLHKHLPKAILSPEYGGDNQNYSSSDWCKAEMPSFCPKFAEMHQRGY